MAETYQVGAYWGIRKEPAIVCARRLAGLLHCLAHCDDVFTSWFSDGISRQAAPTEVKPHDESALEALLHQGRNRREDNRSVIEELGFTVGLWNGQDDSGSSSIIMQCGSYSEWVSNSVVLRLPRQGLPRERIVQVNVLTQILQCIVTAWQPDAASVASSDYVSLVHDTWGPMVGWITFIPVDPTELPSLPVHVRVIPADTHGSLIIATDEPFSAANPAHVALANSVGEALTRAGLLTLTKS